MHILVVFLIGIAALAGFHSPLEIPEGEVHIDTAPGLNIKLREQVKPLSVLEQERVVKQKYDYSCGSAALATLLKYHMGEDFQEQQVIQGLLQHGDSRRIAERRAFSLLDMKKFVNVLGYQGAGYKADMEDLKTLQEPCIVPIKLFEYRHFAVLKGVYKNHIFLADPWRGNISFTLSEFEEMWYENVIFIVSRKGAKAPSGRSLKDSDLRFIDEDAARKILFDDRQPFLLPAERTMDDVPGVLQYYKN
jgi:hypothetical protein